MVRWTAFVALTGVVLVAVLLLSRASQRLVTDLDDSKGSPDLSGTEAESGREPSEPGESPGSEPGPRSPPSTESLLANVAVSQGLLALILLAGAWYARIPAGALGLAKRSPATLLAGAGLGLALYLANEVGATLADRFGIGHSEHLRELLAPDDPPGWALLLVVVLPVIAGFEELLFRAVLVGVVPAAYGVSPWVMVGVSSVAFGVGHGAQGRGGIAVTGLLGAVLGAAFVVTGSLLAVVVAHYLINALEFLVHEAWGIEWAE